MEKLCLHMAAHCNPSAGALASVQAAPSSTVMAEGSDKGHRMLLPGTISMTAILPERGPLSWTPGCQPVTQACPGLHLDHHCPFLLLALCSPRPLLQETQAPWHLPYSNSVGILTGITCAHWDSPTGLPAKQAQQLGFQLPLCGTLPMSWL